MKEEFVAGAIHTCSSALEAHVHARSHKHALVSKSLLIHADLSLRKTWTT